MREKQKDVDGNFAKRVTRDFTRTLFKLLQEKSLEDISATELCKRCSYPRSTFYNHFDDIYAVMDACWEIVVAEAELDRFQEIPHENRTAALFTMLYTYAERNEDTLEKLFRHNRPDGAMCRSLNNCMRRNIANMIEQCPSSDNYPIPLAIVAEHYGNTVWMLLERCFTGKGDLDRETAMQCLEYLLGTLEKEGAGR